MSADLRFSVDKASPFRYNGNMKTYMCICDRSPKGSEVFGLMKRKEKTGSRRRKGVLLLAFCLMLTSILPCFGTVSAAEDTFTFNGKSYKRSKDVPAIYIETTNNVNRDAYVSCTVVAMDAIGGRYSEVADQNATIRIRGNSTSSGEKKPYNIKFSSKINLFGMGKGKRYCLIANLYDPTLIRNQAAFDFARDMGLKYTPDSMLVDVYFNGRYAGCYQLCEAVTEGSGRVDIDLDKGEFLLERDVRDDAGRVYITSSLGLQFGITAPDEPTYAQRQKILQTVNEAEKVLTGGDYEKLKQSFDIPSMVDDYIVHELFKNVDVSITSARFYYKDGKFYGGPVWDFDLSAGNCDSDYYQSYNNDYGDSAEGIWCNTIWFSYLLQYTKFREALYDRYLELQDLIINLYQDNILGKNYIDRTIRSASTSINRNFSEAGWNVGYKYALYMRIPESTYQANVEYFRDWLRRRNEWLLSNWNLSDRAVLTPTDPSLSVVEDYVTGFAPHTVVTRLSGMFTASSVKCNADGAVLATGDHINGGGRTYIAVVNGDLNCDGEVTAIDYIMLRQMVNGTREVSEEVYLAGCMGASAPDKSGYERIKRYCMKGTPLN